MTDTRTDSQRAFDSTRRGWATTDDAGRREKFLLCRTLTLEPGDPRLEILDLMRRQCEGDR